MPVLAATLTTAMVFFPVTFLYGVSQFLFSALALAVVLSLFASYFVAMTVVPLFCANLITGHQEKKEVGHSEAGESKRAHLDPAFQYLVSQNVHQIRLDGYEGVLTVGLWPSAVGLAGVFVLMPSRSIPCSAIAFFPRTDPGQFVINRQGALGHAPGTHRQYREASGRHHARGRAANAISESLFPTSALRLTSPPSLHPILPRTRLLCRWGLTMAARSDSYDYMDRVRDRLASMTCPK